MSTALGQDAEVAVIGAGVVGCAVALELARRGVSTALLEAETEPALAASGTNSGILHSAFDSGPGELETEMLLASARLRGPVIEALGIPLLRCGALMIAHDERQREALAALSENARRNGVAVHERADGRLEIPDEAVTDPVRYTLALSDAAQRLGAELRTAARIEAAERAGETIVLRIGDGTRIACRVVVNCAGLEADAVARLFGDHSFEIYPRKGEFLVFEAPEREPLAQVLLPIPTERTKGVLVFPTLDGKIVAGPTAVDQDDKRDWSVRPSAAAEIIAKAQSMYPPLGDVEPIASYAGLRPAGRGVNYIIAPSRTCSALVNVAAIRSTGLSASHGIAERVSQIVASLGVSQAQPAALPRAQAPSIEGPWWRRTQRYRTAA